MRSKTDVPDPAAFASPVNGTNVPTAERTNFGLRAAGYYPITPAPATSLWDLCPNLTTNFETNQSHQVPFAAIALLAPAGRSNFPERLYEQGLL